MLPSLLHALLPLLTRKLLTNLAHWWDLKAQLRTQGITCNFGHFMAMFTVYVTLYPTTTVFKTFFILLTEPSLSLQASLLLDITLATWTFLAQAKVVREFQIYLDPSGSLSSFKLSTIWHASVTCPCNVLHGFAKSLLSIASGSPHPYIWQSDPAGNVTCDPNLQYTAY